MTPGATLSRYIGVRFLAWCAGVFGAMEVIVFLLDYVELIRRSASRHGATLISLLEMAALKQPYMAQQIMPFAILFGTMLLFWRMTRSNELVIARSAGVSAWQFLTPAIGVSFVIGVFAVTIFNPIASIMQARYEALEARILQTSSNNLTVSRTGFWLRQSDDNGAAAVIHADNMRMPQTRLTDVTVLTFAKDTRTDRPHRRQIGVARATATGTSRTARAGRRRNRRRRSPNLDLPTNLTPRKIQEGFAAPETMSFWQLPGFITPAGKFRLLGAAPPALFRRAAGAADPVHRSGRRRRRIQPPHAAPRRRRLDDRRRNRLRVRALFPFGRGAGAGSCRRDPGGAGGMDAGGRELADRRQPRLPSRRRLSCHAPPRRRVVDSCCLRLAVSAGGATQIAAPEGDNRKTAYLFSADEVQFDQDLGLIVAKGHVEISQGDEILLADTVTLQSAHRHRDRFGPCPLMEPSGDVIFADYAELHDNFKNGFIRDIRMLLSDRSRLAGNTARRINGTRMEIRRGVYSPCDLCKDDPTRAPVWQIRAERIVDDKELQNIEYYDAEMEIDGVPIMWMPYFTSPDPSVKRQSGFLPATRRLQHQSRVPYRNARITGRSAPTRT